MQDPNGGGPGYGLRIGNGNGGMGGGGFALGQQDEFSWLDLQAVGELVTGEPGWGGDGYNQGGGGYMAMGGGGDWSDQGMIGGEDFGRFF